jgi:hypothetical protein
MKEWICKWTQNDWNTSAGYEVANRGLIEKGSDFDDAISDLGYPLGAFARLLTSRYIVL